MYLINVPDNIRHAVMFFKGDVPAVPAPPAPPKPPSQQQAGSTVDQQMAMQRKKQGYMQTLLGGPQSGMGTNAGPTQNKTLLGM